jgi:hypothetical protein
VTVRCLRMSRKSGPSRRQTAAKSVTAFQLSMPSALSSANRFVERTGALTKISAYWLPIAYGRFIVVIVSRVKRSTLWRGCCTLPVRCLAVALLDSSQLVFVLRRSDSLCDWTRGWQGDSSRLIRPRAKIWAGAKIRVGEREAEVGRARLGWGAPNIQIFHSPLESSTHPTSTDSLSCMAVLF